MREKKKNNLFKRAGLGAILILTLMAPITSCAAKVEDNPFKNYPTTAEVMKDTKTNYTINLRGKDGKVTQLDKKFNYGIKMVNERTSVAMADITDALPDLELGWDGANRIASATGAGKELKYPINKRVMSNNGVIEKMDTSATIDSKVSRTYLPLRSLMESLGYDVEYEHTTRTIDIYEKGADKVVTKPITKPVEKPVVDNKDKAKSEIIQEQGYDTVYNEQHLEKPNYDKMTVIEEKGVKHFPDERFALPPTHQYLTGHYDNFTLYDGSKFYQDFQHEALTTSLYSKDKNIQLLTLEGVTIWPTEQYKHIVPMMVEDVNGILYRGISSFESRTTGKTIFGSTITAIYYVDTSSDAIIKITLSKPIQVPNGEHARMKLR